ncbi:MAG: ABC transporter ATP-binding protein [Caldilineaceae bacterium]
MLTIQALSSGYGKLQILRNINLSVGPGQFVAILGPNGSGKSTLLKSIFGLTDHFAGTIDLGGTALAGLATEAIPAQGIAYVPQRQNVFATMTVSENLQLASRQLTAQRTKESLDGVYDLFPVLKDRKTQLAGKMSGGERQMLAIAIAWLAHPKLMLLDEPSAGLSPLFVTEVFRTLKKLNEQGIGLAVVEQNARSVLKFCDTVYVLREGEVVFHGAAAELVANEDLAKGLLGIRKH